MLRAVLIRRDIGLDGFNELPTRRCVHALYACCNSVAMAAELARARPYPARDALFSKADAALSALSEQSVEEIMQAYPNLEVRRRSEIARLTRSRLERMLGPEGGYDNWA